MMAALALVAAAAAADARVALPAVLQRAAAYVAEFHRQLSGIVAEEHYVQSVRYPSSDTFVAESGRRELRSDLLLVRPGDVGDWVQFRDVFEVDGRPVRDRGERLVPLFLQPAASRTAQMMRIRAESARYNIGTVDRTVNTPTLPLLFLEAAHQARFAFKRTTSGELAAFAGSTETPGAAFRTSTEVWIVEYREKQAGTLIRDERGRDVPARGRFWIEPESGRVLMSELVADTRHVRATIDVSYQSEPLVGLLVPIEMRERYSTREGERIDGVATYGRFRQFQVTVDEKIGAIKK
jgi:hypothetical protein